MVRNDTDIVRMRQEVLDYLAAHPEAADSLEGILAWWLPRQRYDQAKEDLVVVLESLVDEELVQRIDLPRGSCIYKRSTDKSG